MHNNIRLLTGQKLQIVLMSPHSPTGSLAQDKGSPRKKNKTSSRLRNCSKNHKGLFSVKTAKFTKSLKNGLEGRDFYKHMQ